jgi:hypothetical protein
MEINLCPLVKYDLHCAIFHKIHNHSVNLCEHLLYQIFSISAKNKECMGSIYFTCVSKAGKRVHMVEQFVKALCCRRLRVQFLMVSLEFFIFLIVPAAS